MGYLIQSDYNRLIQDVSLSQIISGNLSLVRLAEQSALTEIKSYLVQKYDVAKEFTNTLPYNPTATYKAGDRVYLDAAAYDQTKTYALKALILINGLVYECTTAITVAEVFTQAHWQLLGNQYDFFFAILPQPEFQLNGLYNKGDQVFWKDKVYRAKLPSIVYTHDDLIQLNNTNNYPYSNIFPDDPVKGSTYWTSSNTYSVPADSILQTQYFSSGDNRNQQMVMYVLDVVIYHLYRRIPPHVVPEARKDAYKVVLGWLMNVAKGNDITADLEKIQPPSGKRIRFGSNTKQINSY